MMMMMMMMMMMVMMMMMMMMIAAVPSSISNEWVCEALFVCRQILQSKQLTWLEKSLSSIGSLHGGFLKCWYPTTMGFPTKTDHFGVVLEVPPFKETPTSSFMFHLPPYVYRCGLHVAWHGGSPTLSQDHFANGGVHVLSK